MTTLRDLPGRMPDHGQTSRYFYDDVGYNYRMDGFQGAVLRVKLSRLEGLNRRRQQLARLYRGLLMPRLTCPKTTRRMSVSTTSLWFSPRTVTGSAPDSRRAASRRRLTTPGLYTCRGPLPRSGTEPEAFPTPNMPAGTC
jgi:dTDP-4-amino-4,6-dideoxygalactose transaminase